MTAVTCILQKTLHVRVVPVCVRDLYLGFRSMEVNIRSHAMAVLCQVGYDVMCSGVGDGCNQWWQAHRGARGSSGGNLDLAAIQLQSLADLE